MISPSWCRGANTAERVPTTTDTSPRRMRNHWSERSPSDSPLCCTATRSPNASRNAPATAGVRAISGTSTSTDLPLRNTRSASRRYTSVLPEPVTPCSRNTENPPVDAAAPSASSARACSSVRTRSSETAAIEMVATARKRIALDALMMKCDQSLRGQPLQHIGRDASDIQIRNWHSARRAAQQFNGFLLAALRGDVLVVALRGEHRDANRLVRLGRRHGRGKSIAGAARVILGDP